MTAPDFLHNTLNRPAAGVRGLMLTALVAGAWSLSSTQAQARDDVYWSIGVQSPGVVVGATNAPPPVVVYQRYPSHVTYPVHQPVPVYQQRPIVIQHAPVVVHAPYPYGHGYVRPIVVVPAPSYHPGRGHGPRWDERGRKGRHKDHQNRRGDDDRHGGWHDHRRH